MVIFLGDKFRPYYGTEGSYGRRWFHREIAGTQRPSSKRAKTNLGFPFRLTRPHTARVAQQIVPATARLDKIHNNGFHQRRVEREVVL